MTDGVSPDQDDQIDDLLARMYGSQAVEDQASLDPERAKEEAKKLADLEVDIIKILLQVPSDKFIYNRGYSRTVIVNRVKVYEQGEDPDEVFSIDAQTPSILHGVGTGTVSLHHYFHNQTDQADILDINTQTNLDIHLHTDDATLEQARKILPPRSGSLWTRYLFNRAGKFGKLVFFPSTIIDDREDADDGPWDGIKMVIGTMKPGDFELVGTTLSALKARLVDAPPEIA